jgi:hypothetical protein
MKFCWILGQRKMRMVRFSWKQTRLHLNEIGKLRGSPNVRRQENDVVCKIYVNVVFRLLFL